MSSEIIFALVVIVFMGILIFNIVKAETKKMTYTVYVTRKVYRNVNAWRALYNSTTDSAWTRKELDKIKSRIPDVYHYLLKESRIKVKVI